MENIQHKNLVKLLKWIVNIALAVEVVFAIAIAGAVGFTILYEDEHLLSSFPVTLVENFSTHQVISENEGLKQLDLKTETATLQFSLNSVGYYLLKFMDIFITMVIAIYITLISKKLFLSLEKENPFTMSNAKRIRLIGFLLIIFSPFTLLRGLVYRIYILNNISIEGKEFADAPMYFFGIFKTDFSSNEVWINLDINFQTLLMGATLLVIAEIFRAGVKMKEDNESII